MSNKKNVVSLRIHTARRVFSFFTNFFKKHEEDAFAILSGVVAQTGEHRLRVMKERGEGDHRFQPFVSRTSQNKRRLIARRVGR